MIFWVPGAAKTKGSMEAQQPRGRGRAPRLVQSVEGSERWAALVAETARQAAWSASHSRPPFGTGNVLQYPLRGHVAVSLRFWLPTDDVTKPHTGDVDKLARNVLDALTTAGVYADDVQVKDLAVEKYPARVRPGPGLLCKVWELSPSPLDEQGWAELSRAFPHLTA